MPPRSAPREDVPTWDITQHRPRLVAPAAPRSLDNEPSPLLEAIRAYLERVR